MMVSFVLGYYEEKRNFKYYKEQYFKYKKINKKIAKYYYIKMLGF